MENKNRFLWGVVIVIILILVVVGITKLSDQADAKEVKIGIIAPLSGNQATYGEGSKMGIDLAYEDLKSDFSDISISLKYEDSQGDVNKAVAAAQKLISVDNVSILISAGPSQEAAALAPIAQNSKVPFIAMVSQAPELSDAGDYVFRTMADMNDLAKKLVEVVHKNNYKRAAIVTADYNQATVAAGQLFERDVPASGTELVSSEKYTRGVTDFKTQLIKIKNLNADVIFMNGLSADAIVFLKQKNELGVSGQVISQGSVEEKKVINDGGSAAQGLIFATYNGFPPKEFTDKIQASYGKPFQRWNTEGYETFQFVLEGLKKSSSYDREGIQKGLSQVRELKGVSGNIFTFDDKGNITRQVYLKTIKGTEFVPIEG